jgi:putative SOS response-associated peptidase YedK
VVLRAWDPSLNRYRSWSIEAGQDLFGNWTARVLAIAGLWVQWKEPESGELVSSCTLIATAANEFTRRIHDRMPVLLEPRDCDAWLTGVAGTELLRPARKDVVHMWRVSKRVNSPDAGMTIQA